MNEIFLDKKSKSNITPAIFNNPFTKQQGFSTAFPITKLTMPGFTKIATSAVTESMGRNPPQTFPTFEIMQRPKEVTPSGIIKSTEITGVRVVTAPGIGQGYSTARPWEIINKVNPLSPLGNPIGFNIAKRNDDTIARTGMEMAGNAALKQKYVEYGKQYSNIKVQEQTPYSTKPIDIPIISKQFSIVIPGKWIGRKPQEMGGQANRKNNTITINPNLINNTDVKAHEYGHMLEQPISPTALIELQGYFGKKPINEMKKVYTTSEWQKELIPRGIEAIDQPIFKSKAPTAYAEIRQNLQRYASTVDPMNPEYNEVGMSIAPKYSMTGSGFRIT